LDSQSQEIFCQSKGKNYPLEIAALVFEHSNLMGGGQVQQSDGRGSRAAIWWGWFWIRLLG